MAIFSAAIDNGNVIFKHNPDAQTRTTTGARIFYWLDGYLNGQEGIFRISKLVRDVCGFSNKLVEKTSFAWITKWTSLVSPFADLGFNGTNLPHAYTSLKSLKTVPKILSEQNWTKLAKQVSDVASSLMFAAMLVVNAPLGTVANLVVFVGDLADFRMENNERDQLQKLNCDQGVYKAAFEAGVDSANNSRNTAAADVAKLAATKTSEEAAKVINELTADSKSPEEAEKIKQKLNEGIQAKITKDGTGKVDLGSPTEIVQQVNFLQTLKVAKVALGVLGGAMLVCSLALPLISTHAVTTMVVGVCQSKMLGATLSVASSLLAVYANYFKTTMVWQVDKITA